MADSTLIETLKFEYRGEGYEAHIHVDNDCRSIEDAVGDFFSISYQHHCEVLGTVHESKSEFIKELRYIEDNYEGKGRAARMKELRNKWAVAPVYAYVHSGATISMRPFGCRFDLGQSGFIYAKWEDILRMMNLKRRTKAVRERVAEHMAAFVAAAAKVIEGDVRGYILTKTPVAACACPTCEHRPEPEAEEVDACWGMLGDDVYEHVYYSLVHQDAPRAERDALRVALHMKPLTDVEWRETCAWQRKQARLNRKEQV